MSIGFSVHVFGVLGLGFGALGFGLRGLGFRGYGVVELEMKSQYGISG